MLIAVTASLCLIFLIMLIMTRSLIAALVIVGTVVASLGAAFGLSVLVWQYIIGLNLHWMVLLMSFIILLAVGADYNLLLVARFKEEIGAGLKTGIIRAMGGTGEDCHDRWFGVRIHDGVDGRQRPAGGWSSRYHDWSRFAVRYARCPGVHDAVRRRTARTLVLVAYESSRPSAPHYKSGRTSRGRGEPESLGTAPSCSATPHSSAQCRPPVPESSALLWPESVSPAAVSPVLVSGRFAPAWLAMPPLAPVLSHNAPGAAGIVTGLGGGLGHALEYAANHISGINSMFGGMPRTGGASHVAVLRGVGCRCLIG